MNKRLLHIVVLLIFCLNLILADQPHRTKILAPNIKTLQSGVLNEKYLLPIIELKGNQKINIRFDEMSHATHIFGYSVMHCNADWTLSDLSSNEYLDGYTTGYINDYERSINTHYLYTHYQLNLPNEDMQFKISGNYVAFIYEDNQRDKPIAQVCFSVVEPKVRINTTVRANTDIELNGRYQQLDIDVLLDGYYVREPMNEIKTVVRQNNRTDNERFLISPNYVSDAKLSYINNKDLIFEGGNEYRSFDISSVYAAGRGVESIGYSDNHFDVYLESDNIQHTHYIHEEDVNGKFRIHNQEAFDNAHTEADYMYVHFTLPLKRPFFDGQLFLGGEFNYNLLDTNVRLIYDNTHAEYFQRILLKQGGYNYQYWFLPKGKKRATVERVDGSFWQTKNEYTIYVYHREWGERYDKLVGVKSFM